MSGPEMAIEFIAELDDTFPKKRPGDVDGGVEVDDALSIAEQIDV